MRSGLLLFSLMLQADSPKPGVNPVGASSTAAAEKKTTETKPPEVRALPASEERLADYTLLLVLCTGALVYVAWYQGKQLKATVEQMRETSGIELRAYVNVTAIGIGKPDGRVHLRISNVGKTPAYKVGFVVNIYNGPSTMVTLTPGVPQSKEVMAPGGNANVDAPLPVLTIEETDALEKGDERIVLVRGRVYYVDVFHIRQHTLFNFESRGEALANGVFSACEDGNEAS